MNKINQRFHIRIKLFLILGLVLLFSGKRSFAVNRDSLQNVVRSPAIADTTRINLLGILAGLYENTSTDSMISIANQGIALAGKINYENGKAICLQMLGLAYLHMNEHEKALSYYRSALPTFEKNGNKMRVASILLSMADIFYTQNKFDQAIEYYNKGIIIYDEINFPMGKGFALISIGGIYNDHSNYAEAINYYLKALSAFEKDNYFPGACMALTSIATVYSSLGDNTKALEYINRCLAIDDSKASKEQQLLILGNIAEVYAATNDYDKALLFFNKSLVIAKTMGDDTWNDNILVNISDMLYYKQQYDTAMAIYKAILKSATNISDTNSFISATRGIGRIMIKNGNVKGGIKQLLPLFELVQKKQLKQILYETALDLSKAYENEGDYAKALQYHKIYDDTRDSLFNEKNGKRIQQLQFDHELGKKESRIALLEKDKVIAQDKSEKQKVATSALVIGLALLIAISIILYRSRAFEKRSKEEIVKQKEEIQQQASELEELNHFKDKTFSVLSHDLRSPLGALTSTMMLLDNQLISADEFAMLKPELNRQLSSLNILLDNLLNWSKSYIQGKTPAKPVVVNMHNIVSQNMRLLHDTAAGKQITLANKLGPSVNSFCDAGQMDIVIRNLLSNAVKFTRHNGTVTVSAASHDDKASITIADNGVGMTKEQLNKVFTTAAGNSTYGTEGERGIGIGLLLCYEFVKANNGAISVASEPGKGSTFTIELPAS